MMTVNPYEAKIAHLKAMKRICFKIYFWKKSKVDESGGFIESYL